MSVATIDIPVDTGLIEQYARAIFAQGEEAVVFTILELFKRLAEQKATEAASSHQTPSTPSGMNPPHSLVVVFHDATCDLLHDRPIAWLADSDEILCPGFRWRLGDRFVGSLQRSRMRVSPDVLGTFAARPGTYGKIQVAGQEPGPPFPKSFGGSSAMRFGCGDTRRNFPQKHMLRADSDCPFDCRR